MATFIVREQDIIELLKKGKSIAEIARHYKVHRNSISRSLTNTTRKVKDMEDDLGFLGKIGFIDAHSGW